MLWYLLKTWAGKEEELANEIRRTVPSQMYSECFVIYQERIWRKQQRSIVHVEPLFSGCLFLTCPKTQPLFRCIEQIPSIAVPISCGSLSIFPLAEEDIQFLEQISDENHVVKLSRVLKDEKGNISSLSEPLRMFQGQIERIQFKKRYAMVRHRLWGEDQLFVLGIVLNEDTGQKLVYPTRNTNHYSEQVSTWNKNSQLKRKTCFERNCRFEAKHDGERNICLKMENNFDIRNHFEQNRHFDIRIPTEERA